MTGQAIKTPKTHPNHHVVGHDFVGWGGTIYYCDSYDPRIGFWMTPLDDSERKNVSERAIDRTYHHCGYHYSSAVLCRKCASEMEAKK